MPAFSPEQLTRVGCEIFEAAGCRPEDARAVVDHLVESNLFGHDSHGAIRFHEYAVGLRTGLYQADTAPKILRDAPCSAVVDGGGALGAIGGTFATNVAIEKAREHGLSAVALRNTCHIGRVGAYPLLAARAGLVCQILVNAGHHGVWVAPFGGIDGRLSTNPIAFAAPRRTEDGEADPIMLDMTTSMAAVGKVWVAANRGLPLPEGWILDRDGRPSTNPNDLIAEPYGALLPLGGTVGYKGTGLGMLVEILGGAL
ncbi:MAG: dehydrogenase, partial [Phycisphaeraceae bacterium]|nr:dehydrogenase [Phycisphaeraceae bacterium]